MRLLSGIFLFLLCGTVAACTVVLERPAPSQEAAATPSAEAAGAAVAGEVMTGTAQLLSETPTTAPQLAAPVEQEELDPAQVEALLARGIEVYRGNYCGVCHALTVANTRGTFGPGHDHVGAAAIERIADPNYGGSATTPEEYLLESLTDPAVYIVAGFQVAPQRMPPFGHLSDEDLQAMVFLLVRQE